MGKFVRNIICVYGPIGNAPRAHECFPFATDWPPCSRECFPFATDWPPCSRECFPFATDWLPCRRACLPRATDWPPCSRECLPNTTAWLPCHHAQPVVRHDAARPCHPPAGRAARCRTYGV